MSDKTEKKPASTRIYPITMTDGKVRNIEAKSAAAAVVHAYKPKIGEPLTGSQVAALARSGELPEVAA